MHDQPISKVHDYITNAILNTNPLSSNSLRKCILSLVPFVGKKLKERITNKFGINVDMWKGSNINYVAIIATYILEALYNESLITLSTHSDEGDFGASKHTECIKDTLDVYEKDLKMWFVL